MSDPQHEPFDGLAALYAIGALGEEERNGFVTHLEVCVACVDEVRSLLPVTHGLVHTVAPVDAPPALRARVLAQVPTTAGASEESVANPGAPSDAPFSSLDGEPTRRGGPPRRGGGVSFWLAAMLLVAAAGAGGWYAAQLDLRNQDLQADVDLATRRAEQAELELDTARGVTAERDAMLAVLTSPNLQRLDLVGQPLAPRAVARVLWSDAGDMVLLANGLPALPTGDLYQLWFMAPVAPVSAALVEPGADGAARLVIQVPDGIALPVAMAITVEPAGGSAAPTGDTYLLGQPPSEGL